jgi:hypothetical protein
LRIVRQSIIIGLLLIAAGVPCLGQQRVGFVLELQGKWVGGNDPAALRLGQTLPGGLALENPDPTDGDHIVIANLHGEIIKTIRCRSGACRECTLTGGCYDPVHPLPNPEGAPSGVSTVLNAVVELLSAKPDRYSVHRVRGAESFRSAVVRLEGNAIDLDSLLKGAEPGNYELQFVSLSKEADQAKRKVLIGQMKWEPGEKAILTVNGIEPGLYEVSYQHGMTWGDAWVLLCSGPGCRDMTMAYEEFKQQAKSWDKTVTQSTKQAYQRAYLEYLNLRSARSAN